MTQPGGGGASVCVLRGWGLIFIAHSPDIPEAYRCLQTDLIPAVSLMCRGQKQCCVVCPWFHQRNSQCPFPSHFCVCVWERSDISGCVRSYGDGGSRTGQDVSERWRGQTDGCMDTHLWEWLQALMPLCLWQQWHDQTESAVWCLPSLTVALGLLVRPPHVHVDT